MQGTQFENRYYQLLQSLIQPNFIDGFPSVGIFET